MQSEQIALNVYVHLQFLFFKGSVDFFKSSLSRTATTAIYRWAGFINDICTAQGKASLQLLKSLNSFINREEVSKALLFK